MKPGLRIASRVPWCMFLPQNGEYVSHSILYTLASTLMPTVVREVCNGNLTFTHPPLYHFGRGFVLKTISSTKKNSLSAFLLTPRELIQNMMSYGLYSSRPGSPVHSSTGLSQIRSPLPLFFMWFTHYTRTDTGGSPQSPAMSLSICTSCVLSAIAQMMISSAPFLSQQMSHMIVGHSVRATSG